MLINQARHAGNVFLRKFRQNWRWSKAHRWTHLIEEHDVNPLVRGQRALRKAWWRWIRRDRQTPAAPVFLFGVQRSGTNMLAHGLDEIPEFQVYNEGNTKAFHDFQLRPLRTVESLIQQSQAKLVLFKPLCDSHRAPELLDRFGPKARAIWAYREVDGRVRSAVAKFSDSNLRVLRAYAAGEARNAWQVQRLSPENADFIRSFDFSRLSAESAAALFWYIRNSLYFEMSLDQRSDTILVSYDLLLAEPEQVARALCSFLGLGYRRELIMHIDPRRRAQREPLAIDGRIRERCAELQERLDGVGYAQLSNLAGGRSIARTVPRSPTPLVAH
jgi:Sulfotransferase domain